jgi:hypothetical protein
MPEKGLKITKGKLEAAIKKRADNTMIQRKMSKEK